MKCEDMDELLQAYADGEASADEQSAVAGHLDGCARCRKTLRWIEATKAVAAGLQAPAMPADLKKNLLAAVAVRRRAAAVPTWLDRAREFWEANPWRTGAAIAFAAASLAVAVRLLPQPAEELPLDAVLAAHNEYARAMPLSSEEQILSGLPDRMEAEGVENAL